MVFQRISKLILLFIISFSFQLKAQLNVVSGSGITPQQLVQNVLVGTGVTVSNVKFNGSMAAPASSNQLGSFTTGLTATNLGFSEGLIMATGAITSAINGQTTTAITGPEFTVVPELNQYAGTTIIRDAGVLEFDFIPLSDTIKFRYVFGSREYPGFVCSTFNDIFGFFITGLNPTGPDYLNNNIALIPGTSLPVSINTVNGGISAGSITPCVLTNTQYYHTPIPNITYNGLTTVLTAWALVIPCTSYHLKLEIADLGDNSYDSGVFLEANSFSSPLIAVDTAFSNPVASNHDAIEGCNNISLTFRTPFNVPFPKNILIKSVSGTATQGVDYNALPNMLTIPTGSNSVQMIITPIWDHIFEPTETIVIVYQEASACHPDTLRFKILNYDSLTAVAYGDTTLCFNSKTIGVVTQQGIIPYQYTWSNAAGNTAVVTPTFMSTTQYNITVKDACNKTVTDSVLITVDCDFARAGPDTTICLGGTATLTASGGPVFLWNTGAPTATITVSPTVTTTYIVTVTDVFSDKDSVTVFVSPLPNVIATSAASTICRGDSTTLFASGAQTYLWTANITDFSLNGQQTLANPVISPKLTTTYTLTGTDAYTCVNTASVVVNVSPQPSPHIVAYPNPVSVFEPTVHFYDATSGNNSYFWLLGDGSSSTQPNFYHTFNDKDTGSYLVNVVVMNAFGCIDTANVWVIVRPDATFYIPNSFTPNYDGINDVFKVYGMGILEFEISIYDRWGKMIYTSKNMNEGWDGKIENAMAPDGSYAYIIIYKDITGINHSKSGVISIVR